MIEEGSIVQIGKCRYVAKKVEGLPCRECDIANCSVNKDYDALKAKLGVTSCVDILSTNLCFKIYDNKR